MDQPNLYYPIQQPPLASERRPFLTLAASLMIGIVVLFGLLFSAVVDQTILTGDEAGRQVSFTVMAICLGVIGVLLAVFVLLPYSRHKGIFKTWLWVTVLTGLLLPGRLARMADMDGSSALMLGGVLIFLLGLRLWLGIRRQSLLWKSFGSGHPALWLALAAAGVLLLPWMLNGALGGILGMLLQLAFGLSLGFALGLIFKIGLADGRLEQTQYTTGDLLYDGWAVSVSLFILCLGLAANANQLVFAMALPPLGWAVVGLSRLGGQNQPGGKWLPAAVFLGFSIAWPLMWVDPLGLSLLFAGGEGDAFSQIMNAAIVALSLAVLLSGLALGLRRWLERIEQINLAGKLAVLAALVGIAVLYFSSGLTGFYGNRLFVILKDQADVSFARTLSNPVEKRTEVFTRLVNHAQSTQTGLRKTLDDLHLAYQPYYLVNAIEVQGGPLARLWLQSRPEVDRVLDSTMLRPLYQPMPSARGTQSSLPGGVLWNLTQIHADQVWNELNVTGKGIVVGQSDSGVDGSHPELAGSFRGQLDGKSDSWRDPWNQSKSPTDIGGHGTHTLGSAVGLHVGVAPGATWIGCVNLARNLGNPAFYLDCMQFMVAPFEAGGNAFSGNPQRGANVLNNSWGCPPIEGCDVNVLLPAVRGLRAAGVFVVASAGNDGEYGCSSVRDPIAIYDDAFSVGAVNQSGNLADFSSLGPVKVDGSGRIKPDIAAPGVDVLSSYPGGTYEAASGTSMAGPHVVGVVALMWSANPKLIGNIERTEQILMQTAQPYTGKLPACVLSNKAPNNAAGYGLVDAYRAVQMAQKEK